MFLKVSQVVRRIDPEIGKLQRIMQPVFTANYINKRSAGHSEWANRKGAREQSASKRISTLLRLKAQIQQAVLQEKSANPAINPKLQAVLAEAKKASISQAVLDKMIKPWAASLNHDSINSFTFSHSLGITCIVDISSIHPTQARSQVASVMKKFGFKFDGNAEETHKIIGVINGKKSDVENAYDQAVEDAIQTNCEEVIENDDGKFSFLCHPNQIRICTQSLSDLGYKIDYSIIQYEFPTYADIDDNIKARLEQMEEKLENVPGFVKITLNVE